ncbi:MAG: alcohol dehydrogenase catalytic domain-containing protein [Thermoleophilia bacterium]|jgi:threonine dehydrogenase-like Zn-dependent dehydrogenase|nr:alcohol dehydrogenase catalytic domain-containing protein [Thermoleophilia bacterium]
MRGLTFHGNEDVRVDDVPDPRIERPTDAVVRVTLAGICGSDLHIYHAGAQFGFAPGGRLGHEFIGIVEEVGPEVAGLAPGDEVMASCCVCDGTCTYCAEGLQSSCASWSLFGWAPRVWQHGGAVEGGQSEFVRVPLAASTLHPIPESLRGEARRPTVLPLVDVMSTAWHGLVGAGVQPGDRVVVIGDGAVGLSAVHGAAAKDASAVICLGHHPDRLERATALGATAVVTSRDTEEIRAQVMELTGGEGAHAVIDTISGTASMEAAHACVRAGGAISCLGMDHFMGKTPAINWFDQFLRNIRITGGLVPGPHYFDELLGLVEAGRLDPAPMLTHTLPIDRAAEGYRMMEERREGVVKVAVAPGLAA